MAFAVPSFFMPAFPGVRAFLISVMYFTACAAPFFFSADRNAMQGMARRKASCRCALQYVGASLSVRGLPVKQPPTLCKAVGFASQPSENSFVV